jgi:hypothetical protein
MVGSCACLGLLSVSAFGRWQRGCCVLWRAVRTGAAGRGAMLVAGFHPVYSPTSSGV